MKIIQIEPADVFNLMLLGYEINMIDYANVVYYLYGYNVDQVITWINDVMENRLNAAFFYLEVPDAAE